jgi:outer membrane immunogenic protein
MKKAFLAATTLLALPMFGGFAFAADMAPAPAYDWTGFYLGVNAGYGWQPDYNVSVNGTPLIEVSQPNAVPYHVGSDNNGGFIGGAQAGYNWQSSALVLGIEADIQYSGMNGDGAGCSVLGCDDVKTSISQELNWFGTVRPRIGFAADRALFYATGGLIYGGVEDKGNIDEFAGVGRQFKGDSSSTQVGWTAGGGIEYAFADNWTGKIEYLYYDLGDETVRGNQSNPADGVNYAKYDFENKGNIIRAGFNYKF